MNFNTDIQINTIIKLIAIVITTSETFTKLHHSASDSLLQSVEDNEDNGAIFHMTLKSKFIHSFAIWLKCTHKIGYSKIQHKTL